jgi:hypothetical protein
MTPVARRVVWAVAAIAAGAAIWLLVSLTSDRPVTYADVREHFKYGSIGSEPGVSLFNPVAASCRHDPSSPRCRRSAPRSCPAATRRSGS